MVKDSKCVSLADLAKRWKIKQWKIRIIFERGDLPPAHRIGQQRIFFAEDIPPLIHALKKRGYLPEDFRDA